MTWVWVMLGSALGGGSALLAVGPRRPPYRRDLSGRHADRQRHRLVHHRLLRHADRARRPRVRRHGRAPVRDDRRLRRLHHLLLLQPANAQPRPATARWALAGAQHRRCPSSLCLVAVWLGFIAASRAQPAQGGFDHAASARRDAVAHLLRRGRQVSRVGRSTRRSCLPRASAKLAGATVLRGPMGFGRSSRLHTTKILQAVAGSAAHHRDRRHGGRDQGVPADARHDDGQRARHAGEGAGAAIRRRREARAGLMGLKDQRARLHPLSRAACRPCPPLAIDMALPSLPTIQAEFGASPAEAAAVIAIFIAGFSTAPIAVGPLADRYGRKPVMLAGIGLFTLCALGCALAPSIGALACFPAPAGRRRGRGRHSAARHHPRPVRRPGRRACSSPRVSLVFSVAPLIAPTLGAGILAFGTWRTIFFVLVAVGAAVALLASLWFPRIASARQAPQPQAVGRRRRLPAGADAPDVRWASRSSAGRRSPACSPM